MIKKDLVKKAVSGFVLSLVIAGFVSLGTAYAAQSGGGSSSASMGTVDPQDVKLFEMQIDLDQYLFIDHADEIAQMDFKVIYTGVADSYVEVGITPYKEEFAEFIYSKFGSDIVKVVEAQDAVIYQVDPVKEPDSMPAEPADYATAETPSTNIGYDMPVSSDAAADDEALLKERERQYADEKNADKTAGDDEILTIQIESIREDGAEAPDAGEQPETMEILPVEDGSGDGRAIDLVKTTAADQDENKDKGLPAAAVFAFIAACIILTGMIASAIFKKKAATAD